MIEVLGERQRVAPQRDGALAQCAVSALADGHTLGLVGTIIVEEEEDGNDDPRHPDGRLPLGEANNNGRYEAAARELLTGRRLTDIYVKLISLTFKFMPP
ncbi:MAG TPA: hypothetical protein VGP86_13735 [Xanthobacteraceae bacterium]|nr:hypothetical protein [Xanthobacteraceae bacterium]